VCHSKRRGERTHAERAAINTPLQGGAADIVMAAMLRIEQDELLRSTCCRDFCMLSLSLSLSPLMLFVYCRIGL
jgi:hypothetical protein